MKHRDVIKQIKQNGWYLLRTNGSYGQYKHPVKPGLVTVVARPGKVSPQAR